MAKFKDLYPSELSLFDISISLNPIPKFIAKSNCSLSITFTRKPNPSGTKIAPVVFPLFLTLNL